MFYKSEYTAKREMHSSKRATRKGRSFFCRLLVPVSTVDTVSSADDNGWIYSPIAKSAVCGGDPRRGASEWALGLGWDVAPDADWHVGDGWRDSLPVVKMLC